MVLTKGSLIVPKPVIRMLICLSVCLVVVLGMGVDQPAAQRLYGDGSDGNHVVTTVTTMSRNMNFQNLTVPAGCTLQTAGYIVRVKGTLTVHGIITDGYSGGAGGDTASGGAGGTYNDVTGHTGTNTISGTAGVGGAGTGGNSGGGGGGGGGAKDNLAINHEAKGGHGGFGGAGGRGGGIVRIFANNLANPDGLIHADGHPGLPGDSGRTGEYESWVSVFVPLDIAGGGGGGGGGGNGGNGGTVEIVYATVATTPGTIRAIGGVAGAGGAAGHGWVTRYATDATDEQGGPGAGGLPNGGSGGFSDIHAHNSDSGYTGLAGQDGALGTVFQVVSHKCYVDADHDGYGSVSDPGVDTTITGCPTGYALSNNDCNDGSSAIHPGATDIPGDGIDQNCDGADNVMCYRDADADNYGDPGMSAVFVGTCGSGYVPNHTDNCPSTYNPDQANYDGDAFGNACDADDDNDGVADGSDNCPLMANANQLNNDHDALGDACDPDDDNDGVSDASDNCQFAANPLQEDNDHNGIGNACCCLGLRGNVNMLSIVDVSDLSLLVAYLTSSPAPTLPCPEAGNVNGISIVDVSDLSLLVAYLTSSPPPSLPTCP